MTEAEQKNDQNFAVLSAMLKAGLKPKPKLSAIEYARRFALEKALQQRRYCDAFALWRSCPHKPCRRQRRWGGEAARCPPPAPPPGPPPGQCRGPAGRPRA